MLSACWLIGAYFLAVSSHKRGRLNTSVYGTLNMVAYPLSLTLPTVELLAKVINARLYIKIIHNNNILTWASLLSELLFLRSSFIANCRAYVDHVRSHDSHVTMTRLTSIHDCFSSAQLHAKKQHEVNVR